MRLRAIVSLVVLVSVLGLSRGYADAPCDKGYHDTTPEELATMTATLETAMAAKQPRLDALQARMTELSTQFGEAATSGDDARVQAINQEMQNVQAEYQSIMDEADPAMQAYQAEHAQQYSDIEMSVRVTVNPGRESPDDGAQPFDVPAAASAYQWTSGEDGQQGNALVLFGDWQPSPSGYGLESVTPDGAAPEQPHALAVRIIAHKDRLPSMLEATDFDAMAALLAR